MSLVQSEKNDAKMLKKSQPDVENDISDEETMSEVESKLKEYKEKVQKYEYKLKRLKTLHKEQKEKQFVLNIRQPIDLNTNVKKDDKSQERKSGRSAHRTNDSFRHIQEAKEIISTKNDISSEEENSNTGDKLNKWQKLHSWKVTDEDLEEKNYKTKVEKNTIPRILISKDNVEDTEILSQDVESEDDFLEDIMQTDTQETKSSQKCDEGILNKHTNSIPNKVSKLKSKLDKTNSSNLTKEERISIRKALNRMSDEEQEELIDLTAKEYEHKSKVHGKTTKMKSKSPKRL